MLERKIAILIAGGLLGAQVTVAGAQDIPLRFADDGYQPLPAQEKYFAQRTAANPNLTGASGTVFPPSADTQYFQPLPAQAKYFAERAASNPRPAGASGSVFGTDCLASADDTAYWNTLPGQARYFR